MLQRLGYDVAMPDAPNQWDEARFEAQMRDFIKDEIETRMFVLEDRINDVLRFAIATRAQVVTQRVYESANGWLQNKQLTFEYAAAEKKHYSTAMALRGAIDSLRTALDLGADPMEAYDEWRGGLVIEIEKIGVPELALALQGDGKLIERLRGQG